MIESATNTPVSRRRARSSSITKSLEKKDISDKTNDKVEKQRAKSLNYKNYFRKKSTRSDGREVVPLPPETIKEDISFEDYSHVLSKELIDGPSAFKSKPRDRHFSARKKE
jgi:hypothetical protein